MPIFPLTPKAIFKASEIIQCLSASMHNIDYSPLWINKAHDLTGEFVQLIEDIYRCQVLSKE